MKKTIGAIIGIIITLCVMIFVMNLLTQSEQSSEPLVGKNSEARMISNVRSGEYQKGYYYLDDDNHIMYFDYDTQKEVYLCNKPNCTHEDDSCSSYLEMGEINELFYYDNHLYLVNAQTGGNIVHMNLDGTISDTEEKENPSTIYRMDLDGTNKKKLFAVPSGTQITMPYIIKGNQMYAFLETYENVQDAEHSYTVTTTNRKLISIDLEKGSYKEIADAMNDSFIGIYNDNIVLQEIIYAKDPDHFKDDTIGYIDNLYQSDMQIKLFHLDTEKIENIYQDSYKNMETIRFYKDGIYMLKQHSKKLEYFDFASKQKTALLTLPKSDMELSEIVDDKLLVYQYKDEQAHIESANVIDLKTKEINEFKLMDKNDNLVNILAANDTYYFVEREYVLGEEYTTWAGTKQQDIISVNYALIKKADYWASKPEYIKMQNAK